jgi:hypothetical protein
MPNIGYHVARAEGAAVRRIYAAALPAIVRRSVKSERTLPFDVFSYSSAHDLPEQVASIRSLLRFGGRPICFTIVSDGSHSPRDIEFLEAIDACVAVAQSCEFQPAVDLPYLRDHPTGKQLALIMTLPRDRPALYIDADVRFFAGASELVNLRGEHGARYLADCRLSADERLFRSQSEQQAAVNTGVLFLDRKLDSSLALSRFAELEGEPTFFTNQTMTHLTMHAAGASSFDSSKFVLQLDDQFIYTDQYAGDALVLRHYVRPVRHKFWTALLRA